MVTVGIDEVGRGCWAGPLVAGAVVLGRPITGLKDSKKLSKKRREALNKQIRSEALAVGVGWVKAAEIDKIGLTKAVGLAMERALAEIEVGFDEIIIDGNINYFPNDARAKAMVRADDSEPCVSAASIVAKVARDNWMLAAAEKFPAYGFERHVGYGTAGHLAALQTHGICMLHRRSFRPVQLLMDSAV